MTKKQPGSAASPLVSVVLSTRNRPDDAGACVATILENRSPEFELIIIDQSDDGRTEAAIVSHQQDRRVRYTRTATRGLSVGRNLGVQLSSGEIVAFTDDDCRVAKDWVQQMGAIFAADSEISSVFGRVRIPEGTFERKDYAGGFEPEEDLYEASLPMPESNYGIGANMAFRRSALGRLGPFDPVLGAGAPLKSGEDVDMLFRALTGGLKVVYARGPEVLHLGVRRGAAKRVLVQGHQIGLGAMFYKHVRLGDATALRCFLGSVGHCVGTCLRNGVRLARPIGIRMTLNFLSGALSAYRYGVDPSRRVYVDLRSPFSADGSTAPYVEDRPAIPK